MTVKTRDHEERCAIVRAVIALDHERISDFELLDDELTFYQSRSARAVREIAKQGSGFKEYYTLPTANPFGYVALTSAGVVFAAMAMFIWVYRTTKGTPPYPIYASLLAVSGVAIGWWVVGRMTHRNTIRQNTNSTVFARFTSAPFNDALNRFHSAFGYDPTAHVTRDRLLVLRESEKEGDFEASVAALYILNYLEFIAVGIINGDLDADIIRQTLRGFVCYYYDKCEPYIKHARSINPRGFENLTKLRLAYREP